MKQKTIITIVLVGLAGLIAGGLIGYAIGYSKEKVATINSYEECVAAGYPIQESYPERCSVPNGPSFTNPDAIASVDLQGQVICLEHKNPDQPHTLECAAGLKAENGKTYTLLEGDADLTALAGGDTRVQVQGKVEEKDSDRYQSAGELTVDSYTILE